jgi:hypothetical protein
LETGDDDDAVYGGFVVVEDDGTVTELPTALPPEEALAAFAATARNDVDALWQLDDEPRVNPDRVAAISARIASDLAPDLVTGLGDAEARWAIASLRDVVLPVELGACPTGDFGLDEWAARLAEDHRARLGALAPADRWYLICLEHYRARLAPLRNAAFEYAREGAGIGVDVVLRDQAREVRRRVRDLRDEVREHAPAVLGAIAQQLADVEQDCDYVTGEADWPSDATRAVLEGTDTA